MSNIREPVHEGSDTWLRNTPEVKGLDGQDSEGEFSDQGDRLNPAPGITGTMRGSIRAEGRQMGTPGPDSRAKNPCHRRPDAIDKGQTPVNRPRLQGERDFRPSDPAQGASV